MPSELTNPPVPETTSIQTNPSATATSSSQKSSQSEDNEANFTTMESVYEYLGGAGRYNIAVLITMMLCKAFPGMITLAPNFTDAGMKFNCTDDFGWVTRSPGDENCTSDIPGPQSQCWLAYNCSSQTYRQPCREFHFYSGLFQLTSVSRFGLVCGRAWEASLATTFYFVGFLVGCSLYGALADNIGRLKMIFASALNLSLCTIGTAFAGSLWLYWALKLLAGLGNGGLLTCLYTYALENTDTKHRSIWGFLVHNGWTLGLLIFTLMAYFERNYQRLLLYSGLSVLLVLPVVLLLSESPRWLVSTGRFEAADRVFHRIGRINGRTLSADFSSRKITTLEKSRSKSQFSSGVYLWSLFSKIGIFRLVLIVWFIFFSISMAYFGLSLSVDSLGSDIFANQAILAAVEPVSRLCCLMMSVRLGRRPSIVLSYGLSALSLAATGLLIQWPRLQLLRLAAAVTGKFWITMAFDLAWLYAAEAFPTVLRSAGVGTSSTLARAGALLSTLGQDLSPVWLPLPFLAYSTGPLLVAALAACRCLPETRGRRLPDSLEEGDRFARGQVLDDSVDCDRRLQFEGPGIVDESEGGPSGDSHQ